MKIKIPILFIMGVALLVTSCTINDSKSNLREASDGLNLLLDHLPELSGFEIIKVIQSEFSHTPYESSCYYARANMAIGTSISPSRALDQYVEALQVQGWVFDGTQYENTKVLILGSNALIEIYLGEPGIELKEELDLEQLNQIYESLIFIRLDYMLPSRNEC